MRRRWQIIRLRRPNQSAATELADGRPVEHGRLAATMMWAFHWWWLWCCCGCCDIAACAIDATRQFGLAPRTIESRVRSRCRCIIPQKLKMPWREGETTQKALMAQHAIEHNRHATPPMPNIWANDAAHEVSQLFVMQPILAGIKMIIRFGARHAHYIYYHFFYIYDWWICFRDTKKMRIVWLLGGHLIVTCHDKIMATSMLRFHIAAT